MTASPTLLNGNRPSAPWLKMARAGWVIVAVLAIGMFILAVPARLAQLSAPPPELSAALLERGIGLDFYATYRLTLEIIYAFGFVLVACIIFWRKPDDLMALIAALFLVTFGVYGTIFSNPLAALVARQPLWFLPAALVGTLAWSTFLIFWALFPNGRFIPPWTKGAAIVWLIICIAWNFFPDSAWSPPNWPPALFGAVILFGWGTAAYAQVYRYRRASKPVQRQQTKWLVFGYGAVFVLAMLVTLPWISVSGPETPQASTLIYKALVLPAISFLLLIIPLTLAFSILRYRLWDIDIIIRRTLIYGTLTALGFGLYFLLVGGTSAFLQTQNTLLPALLAIGLVTALFRPLLRRLQYTADRFIPLPERPATTVEPAPSRAIEQPPPPDSADTGYTLDEPDTTMRNPWLTIARVFWLVIVTTAIGLWAIGGVELLSQPPPFCSQTGCDPFDLSAQDVSVLQELQLPVGFIRAASAAMLGFMALSFFVTAGLIFWRKSNDWMGLLVSFTLVFLGAVFFTSNDDAVWRTYIQLRLPLAIVFVLGNAALMLLFFYFPDGRLVPSWRLFHIPFPLFLILVTSWESATASRNLTLQSTIWIGTLCLGLGAQIYRYRRVSGPQQRQQTKWVLFGLSASILVMLIWMFTWFNFPPNRPGVERLNFLLLLAGIIPILITALPVSIAISILRYRLWDIDLIIRRTLIYGGLVGGLALAYFGSVALVQFLSQSFTGPQSNLVVVAITLAIAALFNPMRHRFQSWIDRRFYREKVDARQALIAFAREVRAIIDLPELLRALVTRTTSLLHISHGAVFLADETGAFRLAESRNLPDTAGANDPSPLQIDTADLIRLQTGQPVSRPKDQAFSLLVPLIAPQSPNLQSPNPQSLIGILALGPRLSEQHYSREDQTLLGGLADQAGTAIYVAQLIEEKQAEAARREETERRLEKYRNSPAGRAETFARSLIPKGRDVSNLPNSLIELHALTQKAGTDPETAAMLEPLPAALTAAGSPQLAGIADGYRYLLAGQSAAELLPVGLRELITHLEPSQSTQLHQASQALCLYRLCQKALEVNSIPQIVEMLPALPAKQDRASPAADFTATLANALAELEPAAGALHAYERVDAAQDKLAYLAAAVERLSHVDRLARSDLTAPDRALIQHIANVWLAVVTGAMSSLQTRARLACRLLTRHTWSGEIIKLTLAIRNEGRGAALNIRVSLSPVQEYTLLDEAGHIERLAAGEERQLDLRVRPRLAQGVTQFRAHFALLYDDPYGADQLENFADVVYLLVDEGEFQFIRNPYVIGTPLQSGSPLFFGRQEVIDFILENLAAAHQNNLVLIGQRRTGKTSLLKQLPTHLGDGYVPVYLDGQSLALDPGLANFFYSLATEITFALEDRGFDIAAYPELADFDGSPAAAFEHKFLAMVQQAMGERHLLLLLDEFEELETAVRRGNIDASIFSFLRHLIQHANNLSVIFCGTHRMEELAADYWSVLFNISLYRHIAFLSLEEAMNLIQEPVSPFNMRYDDLALDKMWRVTAGHPYFLQLLCHNLVNRHNKGERNYVTVADVNAAVDEILAAGEAHFIFLWTESSYEERLALTALSRMTPLTGQATPVQVSDYLAEHGVNLERRLVGQTLHRLVLRDILRANTGNSAEDVEAYRWQLGLLGLWVEKYKSLSRVADEIR